MQNAIFACQKSDRLGQSDVWIGNPFSALHYFCRFDYRSFLLVKSQVKLRFENPLLQHSICHQCIGIFFLNNKCSSRKSCFKRATASPDVHTPINHGFCQFSGVTIMLQKLWNSTFVQQNIGQTDMWHFNYASHKHKSEEYRVADHHRTFAIKPLPALPSRWLPKPHLPRYKAVSACLSTNVMGRSENCQTQEFLIYDG